MVHNHIPTKRDESKVMLKAVTPQQKGYRLRFIIECLIVAACKEAITSANHRAIHETCIDRPFFLLLKNQSPDMN
jgi:hypothetical protein